MTYTAVVTTTSNQGAPAPLPSMPRHTPSSSSVMSPLVAILSLLVLIAIPGFVYAFFFTINCPRMTFRRFRRSTNGEAAVFRCNNKSGHLELVSNIRYAKEAHGEEYGSECPVCLSVFVEGDCVRQLSGCKHSFHAACIDKWLYSHSSCPVCRASVPFKSSKRPAPESDEDLRQGLPDAASLV